MAKHKSKKRKRSALPKLLMRNVRKTHKEGLFVTSWDMTQIEEGGIGGSPPNEPDTRPDTRPAMQPRKARGEC